MHTQWCLVTRDPTNPIYSEEIKRLARLHDDGWHQGFSLPLQQEAGRMKGTGFIVLSPRQTQMEEFDTLEEATAVAALDAKRFGIVTIYAPVATVTPNIEVNVKQSSMLEALAKKLAIGSGEEVAEPKPNKKK